MNSERSFKRTADKMQNLLTKQEPEGAYDTNFRELQKKIVT